jgi:general secretion pathway protein E
MFPTRSDIQTSRHDSSLDGDAIEPSPTFMARISRDVARKHLIFGVREHAGRVTVLHAPSVDALSLANLQRWLQMPVDAQAGEPELIARQIDAAYGGAARSAPRSASGADAPTIALETPNETAADLDADLARAAADEDADLLHTGQKGPVVRLVDSMLFDAIGQSASDIHVQPLADQVLIRYRIDGVLATARSIPAHLAAAVVSRIKIMARLDIAERRAPQDGRATVLISGRGSNASKAIDLRISTLPTSFGERVVLRLLYTDQTRDRASIDALQMPGPIQAAFLERCVRSSGMILVTGPTGSGKTTTLYATLRWIIARSASGNAGPGADLNVMTIEDPIEYDLSAGSISSEHTDHAASPVQGRRSVPISQTQVDAKKGLTFASGLRHILRQDPDVIMVGEIRDAETARIAIQASLTGHMVFSTLHTNDAPSAASRLIDLEVEPFLICSTLSCVLAQRLVRLLHAECEGRGCPRCWGTGFRGRSAIFELLLTDDPIRELIGRSAASSELRTLALARGMTSLAAAGEQLVRAKLTTLQEIQRVTLGVDETHSASSADAATLDPISP